MSDSTDNDGRAAIAAKITEAMSSIGEIPKNGRNSFHNYDYATKADIMGAIRGPLAKVGLAVLPTVSSYSVEDLDKVDSNGSVTGTETRAIVDLEVTLIDKDSGGSITTMWVGEGRDNGDKAFYKAYSGALKYWALDTFLLKEGDDPERDTTTDQGRRRRRSNSRSRSPQPPGGRSDSAGATGKQIGFIKGLLKELEIDINSIDWKVRFDAPTIEDITKQQASDMIENLQEMKKSKEETTQAKAQSNGRSNDAPVDGGAKGVNPEDTYNPKEFEDADGELPF